MQLVFASLDVVLDHLL